MDDTGRKVLRVSSGGQTLVVLDVVAAERTHHRLMFASINFVIRVPGIKIHCRKVLVFQNVVVGASNNEVCRVTIVTARLRMVGSTSCGCVREFACVGVV